MDEMETICSLNLYTSVIAFHISLTSANVLRLLKAWCQVVQEDFCIKAYYRFMLFTVHQYCNIELRMFQRSVRCTCVLNLFPMPSFVTSCHI